MGKRKKKQFRTLNITFLSITIWPLVVLTKYGVSNKEWGNLPHWPFQHSSCTVRLTCHRPQVSRSPSWSLCRTCTQPVGKIWRWKKRATVLHVAKMTHIKIRGPNSHRSAARSSWQHWQSRACPLSRSTGSWLLHTSSCSQARNIAK